MGEREGPYIVSKIVSRGQLNLCDLNGNPVMGSRPVSPFSLNSLEERIVTRFPALEAPTKEEHTDKIPMESSWKAQTKDDPTATNVVPNIEIDTISLAELYSRCLKSFDLFLMNLGTDSCRPVQLGYINSSQVSAEYGRLSIWGEQSRANLPARARGSLDDVLRRDEEVKGLVRAILLRLDAVLRQALHLSNASVDGDAETSDLESVSSADSGSTADMSDVAERRRVPKIGILLRQITEQVHSLFEVSSVLRRPTIEGKWIRSVPKSRDRANVDGTLQVSDAYKGLDMLHVSEKIQSWRGLGKDAVALSIEHEPSRPPSETADAKKANTLDVLWLCERLAQANSRRREQLSYWTDHPYGSLRTDDANSRHQVTDNGSKSGIDKSLEEQSAPTRSDANSTLKPPTSAASTRKQDSHQSAATSKHTAFSTAVESDTYGDEMDAGRARTVYAPTVSDGRRRRSNRVPDAPKRIGVDSMAVFCPYCGMQLDDGVVNQRDQWKRHVFRDLRPYVCTYEDCQTPEKMFVRRTDWIYHELQMHRRHFTCRDCNAQFTDKQSLSEHLTTAHPELFSPAQFPFALRLCNAPMEETTVQVCILCGEEMSLVALQGHLAAHLEDLALFVLPTEVDDAEREDNSDVSNRVAGEKAQSRTGSKDSSDASSIEFLGSFAEGPSGLQEQSLTLADIEQLEESEATYVHKIDDWVNQADKDSEADSAEYVSAEEYDDGEKNYDDIAEKEIAFAKEQYREMGFEDPPGSEGYDIWGYLHPVQEDATYGPGPFVLKKRQPKAAAQIVLREAARSGSLGGVYKVAARGYVIGAQMNCDIVVQDDVVDSHHCLIYADMQENVFVVDYSPNGTFVNGVLVGRNQHHELHGGDEIAVSDNHRFVFRHPAHLAEKEANTFSQQYSFGEWIGKGAFSKVFHCVENATGREYVVKIYTRLDDGLASLPLVTADLIHPSIQVNKDILTESNKIYLVTDVALGGGLGQYVRKKSKLSEPETRPIFQQLFAGIEYLHDRHIAHRYIELENILLVDIAQESKPIRVRLPNVGIPEIVGEERFIKHWPSRLTYAAPELLDDSVKESQIKAADVWSLGVVLFACLSGSPPFYGSREDSDTKMEEILIRRLDFASPHWDSVSDQARDLMKNMLVMDPEKRFTIKQCLSHPWFTDNDNIDLEDIEQTASQVEVSENIIVVENPDVDYGSDRGGFVDPPNLY